MATFDCDWSNNQLIHLDISENTTFTFTDPVSELFDGDFRIGFIKVHNTSGLLARTLTWPSNIDWPTSLLGGQNSVAANRTDIFQIMMNLNTDTQEITYYGNIFGSGY